MKVDGYRCDICARESTPGEVWLFVEARQLGKDSRSILLDDSTRPAGTPGHLCSAPCLLRYAEAYAGVDA